MNMLIDYFTQTKTRNAKATQLLLVGLLCLAPAACFESNSEEPAPQVIGTPGGGTPPPQTGIVANDDTLSITPNTSGSVDIIRNDSADSEISLVSFDTTSPKQGTISENSDGTLKYTPATDFSGTDSFSYTIANAQNLEASATVTVRVDAQVAVEGKAYYQQKCAICHSAGSDDTTFAFSATDLSLSTVKLTLDLSNLDPNLNLMGSLYDETTEDIDRLKAYLPNFKQF